MFGLSTSLLRSGSIPTFGALELRLRDRVKSYHSFLGITEALYQLFSPAWLETSF